VIQHVREKMTCRDCERISEPPAPFHVTPRGWAGPNLLGMLLFEKFGQHQPLNRQAERYARERVPLALSTLADQVGAGCSALEPLLKRVEAHVLGAERLHGDDTTVPVLAKGKTHTGRCWVYVRDDRPFGGRAPPAAMFYYSRDRGGAHVEAHLARWSGLLQADAYSGYNKLYAADRTPGPILEAACWAHARRPFFALADIEASARRKAEGKVPAPISPLALEIVQRMDRLFEIERGINGKSVEERRVVRQDLSRPLVDELEARLRAERPKLSRGSDLAKAMDYMLKRWPAFTRFLEDAAREALARNDLGFMADEVAELLEDFRIDLDVSSPAYQRLGTAVLRRYVAALKVKTDRLSGEPIETPVVQYPSPQSTVSGSLTAALQGWKKYANRPEGTLREFEHAVSRFIQLHGDIPIATINRRHVREFREALQAMPVRRTGEHREATLPQL
jgi:hypothetical protein